MFVGNLPFSLFPFFFCYEIKLFLIFGNTKDAEEEDVREHFASCGEVKYVKVIRDKMTNLGVGVAYVCFQEKKVSERCAGEKGTLQGEAAEGEEVLKDGREASGRKEEARGEEGGGEEEVRVERQEGEDPTVDGKDTGQEGRAV